MNESEAIIPSPFSAVDGLLNSFGGAVANVFTDFYVDRQQITNTLKHAGIDARFFKGNRFGTALAADTFKNGRPSSTNAQLKEYIEDTISARREGVKGTWTRRFLRGAPTDPDKRNWWHKLRSLIDSPVERATNIAFREIGQDLYHAKVGTEAASLRAALMDTDPGKDLLKGLDRAFKFRAVGITAITLGFAQLGVGLAQSTISSLASTGRANQTLNRTSMVQSGFYDSNQAYTSRQRAVRAIQMGQSGYKRALGNEAQFLHTHR